MAKTARPHGMRSIFQTLAKTENRHYWFLLYWPFYLVAFFTVERFGAPARICTSCALDRIIPFCEYFVVPYVLWFPFWISMLAYAMQRETKLFKRMMCYFILTFSIAIGLYWLFPNYQDLRPAEFPRNNLFSAAVRLLYWVDTNTNVCPSEHVLGVLAVVYGVWFSEHFSSMPWKIGSVALAICISLSTLFIKQHALLDLIAALPLSALGWFICFYLPDKRQRRVKYISLSLDSEASSPKPSQKHG